MKEDEEATLFKTKQTNYIDENIKCIRFIVD